MTDHSQAKNPSARHHHSCREEAQGGGGDREGRMKRNMNGRKGLKERQRWDGVTEE
jgi:hypothetical protein